MGSPDRGNSASIVLRTGKIEVSGILAENYSQLSGKRGAG